MFLKIKSEDYEFFTNLKKMFFCALWASKKLIWNKNETKQNNPCLLFSLMFYQPSLSMLLSCVVGQARTFLLDDIITFS